MNKKAQVITKRNFLILVGAIIAIALIFGNGEMFGKITIFLIGLFLINPILSFYTNTCIDSFGLSWLEKINLTCEIGDYEFSVTAYFLLSEVLLFILF